MSKTALMQKRKTTVNKFNKYCNVIVSLHKWWFCLCESENMRLKTSLTGLQNNDTSLTDCQGNCIVDFLQPLAYYLLNHCSTDQSEHLTSSISKNKPFITETS